MTLAIDQSLLLLNCLERFERQSNEIQNRDEVVELFCTQAIPLLAENNLIDELRKDWMRTRDRMNIKVKETEAKALEELKETANEIQITLGICSNEIITKKVALIQRLTSGEEKWFGSPPYQILYDELKQLFELLVNAGYIDLCKPYAKLTSRKIYVQTDPNQEERWVKVFEDHSTSKVLSADELEIARKEDEGNLLQVPPDYHLVDEPYIEEFTFAPAVIEAYAAMDAVHWNRLQDPAVIWWYFETALWCWKTTEFYFNEVVRPKNGNDLEKHFKTTCEQATWREIADVRDRVNHAGRTPVIFTTAFFRTGIRTLANAIASYLSQDPATRNLPFYAAYSPTTTFELVLDGNELWVHVTFENQSLEKFYVQKFHEGADPAGSRLHQFMKETLKDPNSGVKRAKLTRKWESASKHIHRLNLPQRLKQEFFTKSHGSHFQFNGARLSLKLNSHTDVGLILQELRQNHLKSKNSIRTV